jgi:hypothetical protein
VADRPPSGQAPKYRWLGRRHRRCDFQAFQKSTTGINTPDEEVDLDTVFEAEFVTRAVVVATPLPGALVLVTFGGLGAAALAIRRARS